MILYGHFLCRNNLVLVLEKHRFGHRDRQEETGHLREGKAICYLVRIGVQFAVFEWLMLESEHPHRRRFPDCYSKGYFNSKYPNLEDIFEKFTIFTPCVRLADV